MKTKATDPRRTSDRDKRPAMATDPRRGFVWKCADGRQLKLSQITDKHLGNILRFLDRKALGKDGFYDHEPFEDIWRVLHDEVVKRGFAWRVFPHMRCSTCDFKVGDTKCFETAVMYTAKDEVGTTKIEDQEARCARHRPDAHQFYKKTCEGCFKEAELVVELGGHLYCQECTLEPEGVLWDYLAVFFTFFAWITTLVGAQANYPLRESTAGARLVNPTEAKVAKVKSTKRSKVNGSFNAK